MIRSLEGITEINFVAHSLGNLVVRHWLKDFADEKRTLPKGQTFGRMVMLAPPNQQPQLATKLIRGAVAKFVAGPAAKADGHRLGRLWRPSWRRRTSSSASWPAARATAAATTRSSPATTTPCHRRKHAAGRGPRFPRAARAAQLFHERQAGAGVHAAVPQRTAISKATTTRQPIAAVRCWMLGCWILDIEHRVLQHRASHSLMRIAGIDYGTVRIGIATGRYRSRHRRPVRELHAANAGARRRVLRHARQGGTNRPVRRRPAGASARRREPEIDRGASVRQVARRSRPACRSSTSTSDSRRPKPTSYSARPS